MFHSDLENLLKQKINLSASNISQASQSHNYVRGLLDRKSHENNNLPWLLDGDFLSGSYARQTKIHPIDDIDIIVVLDGAGLFAHRGGYQLSATVRGSGSQGSPVLSFTNEQNYISSQKILNEFRNHLSKTYPNSKIRKDGQAINVWLDSYGLGIDIVPAFHIVPNDKSRDYYYIPVGYGEDNWMSTNPKIDQEICDNLNDKFNKKLKPIIKLIKYWNSHYNNNRLKSYHLEVIIWNVFNQYQYQINNYCTALKYFFANADKWVSQSCSDPTGLGENIDSYLASNDRLASVRAIKATSNILNQTLTSAFLVNKNIHLPKWRTLFGSSFGS